jgi:acetate---CoA ligase (ADP-forming)
MSDMTAVEQAKPNVVRNRMPDVEALVRPKAIAVVGAAATAGKMGGHIWHSLHRFNPYVPHYAVSTRQDPGFGDRWLPSIEDAPAEVDQAILCTPAVAAAELVRRCDAAGLKTVVVLASGFGEIGTAEGRAYEAELRQAIAETDITVLGPNCVGYFAVQANGDLILPTAFSVLDPESPDAVPIEPKQIAIVSQSGGLGSMVVGHLRNMGVWPWCYISTGNEYDLTIWDAARGLANDPATRVVGLYLEGLQGTGDLASIVRELRAAGKQLVVMLGGRTDEGSRAVLSHTGRLANDGSLYPAFLEQEGICLAKDPWELAVLLERAATLPQPGPMRDCAIITASGGMGTITSDLLADSGVSLPPLGEETGLAIRSVLPAFASTGDNPIDVGGGTMRNAETLGRVLRAVGSSGKVDFTVMTNGGMAAGATVIAEGMLEAFGKAALPAFVFWPHCGSAAQKLLWSRGVPCVGEGGELMRVIELTRELGKQGATDDQPIMSTPPAGVTDRAAATLRRLHALGAGLTEQDAKAVVADLGLRVPGSALVHAEADLDAAIARTGLPAVAKGQSRRVTHKREAGLVRTGLRTPGEARAAYGAISAELAALGEPAEVLLEEQIPIRLELLVGWSRTSIGLAYVFGCGGSGTEVIADNVVMFPPVNEELFRAVIQKTVVGRVLAQQFPELVGPIAVTVVQLASLAAATPDLRLDLDINPLAISSHGELIVLDAAFSASAVGDTRD